MRVAGMPRINAPGRFAVRDARTPTGPRKSPAPQRRLASVVAQRQRAERDAELNLAAADVAGAQDALRRLQPHADRAITRIARLGAMQASA